jgi:hypothetical protein
MDMLYPPLLLTLCICIMLHNTLSNVFILKLIVFQNRMYPDSKTTC